MYSSIPHWYALYTHSRAEKKVAEELERQGIEHYLPLYKTLRQWSDRKKKVELPLIRSYLFVKIREKKSYPVLQTPGVMRIVSFSGRPVPIPDWQIENLRIVLGAQVTINHESLTFVKGSEVLITRGALQGLRGTILRVKGHRKLVISISALKYSFTIDIGPWFVEQAVEK